MRHMHHFYEASENNLRSRLALMYRARVSAIHRAAEKEDVLGNRASGVRGSRKPSFRREVFSETSRGKGHERRAEALFTL
jgi:hypothetical protein